VALRTPVEESLAAIWRKVVKIERVGVENNFFNLGGDSLRAMDEGRVASREDVPRAHPVSQFPGRADHL
jgi:hypothetical protein